jgi:HPt (histidine-containing phosphotransfer) domain-containing protein
MVFHEQGQNDRLKIMLVDFTETSSHIASILENKFKSDIIFVIDQEDILDGLKQKPDLILIMDKRTGELGPNIGRAIRKTEEENDLDTTSIITLLSEKTFDKAKTIDVSDIKKYHFASQTEDGLQNIIGTALEEIKTKKINKSEKGNTFDPTMIEELLLIGKNSASDLVNESIDLYFDQYEESVQNIKEMWIKNEPDRLREIAHFMKSSSFTMGANEVAYLFSSLEQAVLKDKSELEEKISQIDQSFERAKNKLLTYYHINK